MNKPKRSKKFDLQRAKSALHEALFDMRRMDFDLISAFAFASGAKDPPPSDAQFYHLVRRAYDVAGRIEAAHEHLKPYLKKVLADPDAKPSNAKNSMDKYFPVLNTRSK